MKIRNLTKGGATMSKYIGVWILWILTGLILSGCEGKIERNIEKLEGSQEDREQAMMELVLAKEDAIPPLIKALGDAERPSKVRVDVATVLFRMYMRESDSRILPAFITIINDKDPHLRSRIVIALADIGKKEGIAPLFGRLDDPDEEVLYQALCALESLGDKIKEGERDSLVHRAAMLTKSSSETESGRKVRQKAEELLELAAERIAQEAEKLVLKADLKGAEAKFLEAKEQVPNSLNVNLKLGKFYFDNGQEQKGLNLLSKFNLAVYARRLRPPPHIDGDLGDACWKKATVIDSLYLRLDRVFRPKRATGRSEIFVGYTGESFYIALKAYKNRKDIVAAHRGRDSNVWRDDSLEMFLDTNRDYRTYIQICVNSLGEYFDMSQKQRTAYNGEFRTAAKVEENFWSVEIEIPYKELGASKPQKGTIWGFNAISTRMGVDAQQAQWVPTYGNPHNPSRFGFLIFE
jgi:hypothetical protein